MQKTGNKSSDSMDFPSTPELERILFTAKCQQIIREIQKDLDKTIDNFKKS